MAAIRHMMVLMAWGISAVTPVQVVAQDAAGDICPMEIVAGAQFAADFHPSAAVSWSVDHAPLPWMRSAFATAPARVFLDNPGTTQPEEVTLVRLHGDGTRLDGQYVRAKSDVLDKGLVAASGVNGVADFRYEPDLGSIRDCILQPEVCPAFDAVNVYWHMDRFAHEYWVGRIGLDIDYQVEASVHVKGDGGIAYPPTRRIHLATGDIFMKNGALSDDLIYHEYTHIVAAELGWKISIESTVEERALSEGFADYFAASYTNSPLFGDWIVTCPDRAECLGPQNDLELRRLDLPADTWNWRFGAPDEKLQFGFCLRFHTGDGKCKASYNNYTDQYVWAIIWGNMLWDLRVELGGEVADQLAIEAIRHFEPGLTFETAAGGLLAADVTLFGGAHRSTMEAVMFARGIAPATAVHTENTNLPGADGGNVELYPYPATSHVMFDGLDGATDITVHDIMGRMVLRGRLGASDGSALDVSALPAGWYAVRIVSLESTWSGTGRVSGRLLVKPLLIVR